MPDKTNQSETIDLTVLKNVLKSSEVRDRIETYQYFRLEAFNYMKQLEYSVDQKNDRAAASIAKKFRRSALFFGGVGLAKQCYEFAARASKNKRTLSRLDLHNITHEKDYLVKAIDGQVALLTNRS